MTLRRVALLLVALVLAGCGETRGHGTARLWVTRDRGAHVLYSGSVPAGLTALQALERRLDVTTRYGGRFVQSIAGVEGSASSEHDWFYFVNGVEAGRGAAEVRLRPGDVEWWDYRSWRGSGFHVPVVVGAFPEPFKHGFEWAKPGAQVAGGDPAVTRRLARFVGGRVRAAAGRQAANQILVRKDVPAGEARIERHANGVRLVLGRTAARRLAADPAAFRYRYEVAG